MPSLAAFHPQVVHFVVALVIVGVEGSTDMRAESPTIRDLKHAAHTLSVRLGSTRYAEEAP